RPRRGHQGGRLTARSGWPPTPARAVVRRPRKPDMSRAPWFVRKNNLYPERTVLRAPRSRLAMIVLMGDKRGKPRSLQVSWYFTARVARMGTHAPTTAACGEGHGSAAHLDHDRSRAGCRHCCYGDFDRAEF